MNKTYSFNDDTANALVKLGVAELYDVPEKITYENKMMNNNLHLENKSR